VERSKCKSLLSLPSSCSVLIDDEDAMSFQLDVAKEGNERARVVDSKIVELSLYVTVCVVCVIIKYPDKKRTVH